VMQNPEILKKNSKMSYYLKDYILPSGTIIKIQGYEHYALDELFEKENINENNIVTGCKNVPAIWYNDLKGKKHRHFVDIYLPLQNRCIEVKSTWTFQKQKEIVFLKLNAAKDLGYFYEIWVFDNNGNKVDFHN
jgi:DNA repair protein RadC